LKTASAAAEEEIAFAESLAIEDKDTLIAVHRTYDGEIREAFRSLRPRSGPKPLRAFSFMEVEGEEEPQTEERVDLASLAERDGR